MRVVSQWKDVSYDFDRAVFWIQYEYIYAASREKNSAIGKYSSQERAQEVFQNMHDAYSMSAKLYSMPTE